MPSTKFCTPSFILKEYQDLLADCNFGYFAGLIGDKTAKNRISELQGKYRVLSEKYEFEIYL